MENEDGGRGKLLPGKRERLKRCKVRGASLVGVYAKCTHVSQWQCHLFETLEEKHVCIVCIKCKI